MADKTLPPIAIGDSLAVGMREANNLPGLARVGAGPKEVFEKLQQFATENSLAGRDVFLGTGMPNIPEQRKYVEQQIDFVRKQGGNPILIGVGPGTKSKPTTGQNEFLAGLAERKGLTYMGPLVNMFPDVTKDPMGLHLRPKQYQQIFKQFSKSQPVPQQTQPQPQQVQPQSQAPSASDLLSQFTGAVMQAESLGKRYDRSGKLLTSPKGAQGEMQVMPGTVTDPGFGVRPAKNNSPDEIARVGRDYAAVMLRRYNNDPTAAAVAYNWGPGNADKWVKRGADFESLPKETQNYVTRITGRMGVPIAAKRVPPPPKRVEKTPSPRAAVGEDYAPLSTLEPAPRTVQQGPATAQPQQDQVTRADMERMGPGYQAAFAAMTLGDSREDDDEYDDDETIAERYLERREMQMAQEESTLEEDTTQSSPLASLSEISYQSPFAKEEPVMLADGGVVYRADGSPMYGEGVDLSDSGGMTADTIKNLFSGPKPTAREALSILGQIGAGGVSNIESTLRGSVAAIPGFVGDVESGFRDDKSRRFMTTEEVKRDVLPSRLTAPNKYTEGYEELGTYLPLPVNLQKVLPPSAVKGLIAKARGMLPAKEVDTFPMGKLSAQEVLQQLKSFDPKKLEKAREAFLAPSAEKRRMYHGTFQQPLSLELTKAGEVNRILGMSDQGFTSFRPGTGGMTFVSPQTEFADMFAGMRLGSASKFTGPSRVYPVHVQVKKPFDFENTSHLKEIAAEVYKSANKAKKDKKLSVHTTSWMNSPEDIGFALSRGSWAEIENPLVIDAAKKLGFDGMYMLEAGVKNLGIFDPKKIKSAIGNEGSFNVKNPDIRKAEGGVVHRAEGSPVYGEDADLSNSGVVTADTIKNLFSGPKPTPREMLGMFKDLGKESLSNLESVGRRSVAGLPGTVGSIESIFRDDKDRRFATGEEIERQYLPKRLTTPTKDAAGYGEIGEFIDPTIALKLVKPTARATLAALKASGPQVESALMKVAPTAQPMGVIPEAKRLLMETPETSLFVSKVDDFIAAQQNPVTKQQLLGQMKGKFRDYEIGRVSSALADLPDNARLLPNELLAKIQASYPTNRLKTYVLEPQKIDRWSSMDNVYSDQPVGVVNLRFDTPMNAVYNAEASQEALSRLKWVTNPVSFSLSSMKAQDLVNLSGAIKKLPDAGRFKNLTTELDNFYSFKNKNDTSLSRIEKAISAYKYPATIEGWSDAVNDYYKKSGSFNFENAQKYANEFMQKEADKILKEFKIAIPSRSLDPAAFIKALQANGNKKMQSLSELEKDALIELNSKVRPEMEEAVKEFKKTAIYEGQHKSLTPKGEPVAFSRFVDHTTSIPGRGNTKVMHMIELQSDLLDDIFKKGSKSGNKASDTEELKKLGASIKAMSASDERIGKAAKALDNIRATYSAMPNSDRSAAYKKVIQQNPEIEKELIEYLKLRDKEARLNIRTRIGDYSLKEAFPGMEGSPQVVQQMMIKNAIGAAMQRGVNAVTFPGKESAQAQLYEKLYPNLKQAVKDIGAGLEVRQIELYDSFGVPYSHWGVVWDDSTAKKVLNQGIRFNKGGLVDKQDSDNRKFI
jgi:hypothetical protein